MRRPQLRHAVLAFAVVTATIVGACGQQPSAGSQYNVVATVDAGPPIITTQAPPEVASTSTTTDTSTQVPTTLLDREVLDGGDPLVDHKGAARALLAQKKVPEAIASLRRALATDASADVWAALGDAYLQQGDIERGLSCLREATSLDVHHLASRKVLTRHYLEHNAGELARQEAVEWVRLEPTSPTARQALGRSYTQLGMWREAIESYELVLAQQPHNAYAHNNLGFAALQLGDTQRALVHLEQIVALRPQHGFMFNNLGVAYERAGRPAEAHAAFARAAELSPKYQLAGLNRDRLQRGLDHAQRIVAADTLLRLRDGSANDIMPLGGDAPTAIDLPATP